VRNFAPVIDVWDPATGDRVFDADVGGEVSSIDWSNDGEHLVAGTFGSTAVIFDQSGHQVGVLSEGEGFFVDYVSFSPDGRLVATSVTSQRRPQAARVSLWDWESNSVARRIPQPKGTRAIAFDPRGSQIAIAHENAVVEIYDVDSGESQVRLPSTGSPVGDVEFSPDGTRIAAGSDDGTVRLFDLESGDQLLVLRGHDYLVSGIAFSPDGAKLASASPDGIIRIWALELDDLIRIARDNLTRRLTDAECRQYLHRPCPVA
jgi:WD40 repeat protein